MTNGYNPYCDESPKYTLRACPRCGHEAMTMPCEEKPNWRVECLTCRHFVTGKNKKEAIKNWNNDKNLDN